MAKSPEAFRTISEVAEWLGTPAHVLRFWESRFAQVKPVKRAGGRRYYRPADMELLGGIKQLLHEDGMTIRGVQKLLRTEGVRHVASFSMPLDAEVADAARQAPVSDNPAIQPQSATPPDTPAAPDAPAAPVDEAPMSVDVEPEPLDNLVALDPAPPVAAQPAADPAMAEGEPVAVAPTGDQPAQQAGATRQGNTDEPAQPVAPEPAHPAPLFQSAHRMRDTAEPVMPAPPTDAAAMDQEPQSPPSPGRARAPLGTNIPEDPVASVNLDTGASAPVPNIISLAQAMRAQRTKPEGGGVEASRFGPLYDRIVQLRDQMRAKS